MDKKFIAGLVLGLISTIFGVFLADYLSEVKQEQNTVDSAIKHISATVIDIQPLINQTNSAILHKEGRSSIPWNGDDSYFNSIDTSILMDTISHEDIIKTVDNQTLSILRTTVKNCGYIENHLKYTFSSKHTNNNLKIFLKELQFIKDILHIETQYLSEEIEKSIYEDNVSLLMQEYGKKFSSEVISYLPGKNSSPPIEKDEKGKDEIENFGPIDPSNSSNCVGGAWYKEDLERCVAQGSVAAMLFVAGNASAYWDSGTINLENIKEIVITTDLQPRLFWGLVAI